MHSADVDDTSAARASRATSQLALRNVELCAGSRAWRDGYDKLDAEHLASGMTAGLELEVHVEKDGRLCWTRGVVVAVW